MPGFDTQMTKALMPSSGLLLSAYRFCLDLIFPPRCAGCGCVDTLWCARCQYELDTIPIEYYARSVFDTLEIVSTGQHTGMLQRAVQALKYENIPGLRLPLSYRLITAYQHLGWNTDLVVPVPMHPNRRLRRGYNQAELLSLPLARRLSLPYYPDALSRSRETPSQVGLSREERLSNVTNAFTGNEEVLDGRVVLLVDDVCTSGATMTACAQTMMQCGAQAVFGLTVTTA